MPEPGSLPGVTRGEHLPDRRPGRAQFQVQATDNNHAGASELNLQARLPLRRRFENPPAVHRGRSEFRHHKEIILLSARLRLVCLLKRPPSPACAHNRFAPSTTTAMRKWISRQAQSEVASRSRRGFVRRALIFGAGADNKKPALRNPKSWPRNL